jgi:HSP20 family protein
MPTRFSDFDSFHPFSFRRFDQLRRDMDRLFEALDTEGVPGADGSRGRWLDATIHDGGQELVISADVPGLTDKDVRIQLTNDVLTVEGERTVKAPEGYSAHRQERAGYKFSRSFTLPCKIDADRCTATVKDGVLTVQMAKAKEAQPRQIAVKSGNLSGKEEPS